MKTYLIVLGLASMSFSVLSAQSPGYFGTSRAPQSPDTPTAAATPVAPATTPAFAAHSRILTEDDFRAFLTGTTWQWNGPGLNHPYTLSFYADGTARNSGGWVAKFVIKNTTEIELQMDRVHTAKMTFDPTYTHYDGIDFNKKRPLQGRREK